MVSIQLFGGSGMSRDWQKDMELAKEADDWEFDPTFNGEGNIVKDTTMIAENIGVSYAATIFNVFEALPYWINEAAAEKERADKAEASEQKLREVIEEAMEEEWRLAGEQTPVYIILCQSLDPKEGTK
jgi:hypothetical protein